MEWTKSAKEELDKYLERAKPSFKAQGADPAEVIEDFKRHIDEELAASTIDIVTLDDIKRIILKIGFPEPILNPPTNPTISTPNNLIKKGMGKVPWVLIFLGGILIPFITLGIEATSHFCAGVFFDPIPTPLHIALVSIVPLSNLLLWLSITKQNIDHKSILGWMNGIAIGVSSFYTVLYLPILPIAFIAIAYIGMGLLPLAPLLALLSAIWCRIYLRRLTKSTDKPKIPGLWYGIVAGIAMLMIVEVPATITRVGMDMAVSDSPKTQLKGVKLLRSFGDDDLMLRLCYQRSGRATDIISFIMNSGDTIRPDQARKIYYRVKGIPFNSVPPSVLSGSNRWEAFRFMEFDDGQGGESVAGVVKGLSLASSRIDSSIDSDAALAYTEWTMEFENKSRLQREARAQIALPPGGVVSRLSLWINGEEREAAFAGRKKVREAYQKVVRRRRDPVLVTTSGPDRVIMQCFPVPPGGTMKVRIGVTSPLTISNIEEGALRLPRFIERNFKILDGFNHSLWMESKTPLSSNIKALVNENPENNLYAIRGHIDDQLLKSSKSLITTTRDKDTKVAWTPDPGSQSSYAIKQILEEWQLPEIGTVVLLLDGSQKINDYKVQIANALKSFPVNIKLSLVVASDESQEFGTFIQRGPDQSFDVLQNKIDKITFVGGQDNVPSLIKAWDIASSNQNSIVIWIHGTQPIILKSLEELKQKWDRRPNGPIIYEIQTDHGPNRIIEELDGIYGLKSIPRLTNLEGDLKKLFKRLEPGSTEFKFARTRVSLSSVQGQFNSKKTSSHLLRLWAHDKILKLYREEKKRNLDEAIQLAANYQLVTPVSGAVVLETAQQYKDEGLEPVNTSTVPTIPEPETWALIIIVALIFGFLVIKIKRRQVCRTK